MASCLCRGIEDFKNRVFQVQQNSKIPVRRVPRLNSDSVKSSSDEAEEKLRMLRDSVDSLGKKRPSRIPIMSGRRNSKTDENKLCQRLAAVIGKKPLGTDSGITLRGTPAGRAKLTTANPPTAAKCPWLASSKPLKELTLSTLLVRQSEPRTAASLVEKQVPKDEKVEKEHAKAHEKTSQSVDFVPPCNSHGVIEGDEESVCGNVVCCVNNEAFYLDDKIHNKEMPENDAISLSVEDNALMKRQDRLVGDDLLEGSFKESLPSNERLNALLDELNETEMKSKKKASLENMYTGQEVSQIEKENSEVIEELQKWIDDGDRENKVLEEVIEKFNEENVKLLVQISVMQKEMKALAKKNDTLQTELEMRRVDIKRLKGNEYYMERELRNLKRDLKRKEQNLEEVERNLDKALMERQELSDDVVYLEGRLKASQAVNEKLNVHADELNEMVKELTKRPCYGHFREEVELLKGSLDLGIHPEELFKSSVEEDTSLSSVIDQLEEQLALFEKENARVLLEKEEELNDMKYEKSRVIEELEDKVEKLRKENSNIITDLSEKDKRLCDLQLQVENLRDQNELFHNKLNLVYRSLSEANFKNKGLMEELQHEKSNEEILNMALELAVNNYVVNEKVHSIKTRELQNELAEMKRLSQETQAFKVVYLSLSQTLAFLVNKNGFCSEAGTKIKLCL